MLRVLICGSVDDGKSTLIGRLLHDTASIPEDQLASIRVGPCGAPDLSLLTDGLEAEREQGITIDVAYRHLRTARNRLLLVDCPGHELYTRNMATGAAGCGAAIVVVDAKIGLRPQTRRHVLIAKLMGVKRFIGVVNKMDLADWSEHRYREISAQLDELTLGESLPACATSGDGLVRRGPGWWHGQTLLELLERLEEPARAGRAFRMPVQFVNRGVPGRRLYAGTIVEGQVSPGDRLHLPGGDEATVLTVLGPAGPQASAGPGQAVALEFQGQHDVARGDVLSAAAEPVARADQFQARLVWCSERPLLSGRTYLFKIGTNTVAGNVSRIRHVLDVDTGGKLHADEVRANEIAVVNLSLAAPVGFMPFADCPELGGFIVIDRETNATMGAGTIDGALNRSANVTWQDTDVSGAARAALMGQRPAIVWFTGLSGAGKSTVANRLERRLHAAGRHTYMLDGDNLRHGLCRDLGFTEADRVENVRRAAEAAALMADAGLIVLVCLISPYRADRQAARERSGAVPFLEVFVDAPVDVCRERDPKGLYAKADRGAIPNFTGVSAPYEAPEAPEVHLRTDRLDPAEAAELVMARLEQILAARP
ncbi:MAG TPA: adenylyl-sulfate kinase [Acetobacteraceae bacterium]|nr:adenylyl-sulfate kinase [Acetobacteraceae bacterium]